MKGKKTLIVAPCDVSLARRVEEDDVKRTNGRRRRTRSRNIIRDDRLMDDRVKRDDAMMGRGMPEWPEWYCSELLNNGLTV
jgi:hypothetical protein